MWSLVIDRLERSFRAHPRVAALLPGTESDVVAGRLAPSAAADLLLREAGLKRDE
jgi:hypothetical protein